MLENSFIENCLKQATEIDFIEITGDGQHYYLTMVAAIFEGKSRIARQRWVYEVLKTYILDGSLHALSMQTWTKAEWEKKNG